MSLDPHTLVFAVSLLGLLTAGLTRVLARATKGPRDAVFDWSRGMLCVGAAFLIIFFRAQLGPFYLYVVANALVMAFPLLALRAYSRLFATRFPARPVAVLFVVQVTALVAFQVTDVPRELAVIVLCTSLALEFAAVAALIARHRRGTAPMVHRVATGTMALLALLFVLRVGATLAGASPSFGPAAKSGVEIVTLLVTSLVLVGSTVAFVLMALDRQYRSELENAQRDALTGLYTRDALFDALRGIESVAGGRYALVMIDVDHFKAINDRHGHAAGDAVLAEIGAMLRRSVRSGDIAGRYGGEEFCVVLRNCGGAEAQRYAARLVEAARDHHVVLRSGEVVRFTLSAGHSTRVVDGNSSSDCLARVLDRADAALYEAKRRGRNRVVADDRSAGSPAIARRAHAPNCA